MSQAVYELRFFKGATVQTKGGPISMEEFVQGATGSGAKLDEQRTDHATGERVIRLRCPNAYVETQIKLKYACVLGLGFAEVYSH